jgi:hypothetical protein
LLADIEELLAKGKSNQEIIVEMEFDRTRADWDDVLDLLRSRKLDGLT